MNCKTKTRNYWQILESKNLGYHSDENFKLVQFVKFSDGPVLFDLRETNKGRKTKVGISLIWPEFKWLRQVLKSNDLSTHTLEHNQRIIKVDKVLPEYLITVTKSNGGINSIILTPNELIKLKEYIEGENVNNLCVDNSDSFPENSFHRITIN